MFRLDNTTRNLAAVAALLLIGAAAPRAHAQGSLVSWGSDSFGRVSATPAGTFSAVAMGRDYAVAIRTDGTLVSWGANGSGVVSGTPAGTFSAVAAGFDHAVAIRTDGTLVSWGDDDFGQVSGTPDGIFTAIAAGVEYSVAIRTDGTLVSWDTNFFGGPLQDPPAGMFSAVEASFESIAIRTDGTLVRWEPLGGSTIPGTPPAGTFSAVALGFDHAVAIRTDGTLVSWGVNGSGVVSGTPAGTFSGVAGGSNYSVAIRTDGTLVSWGRDDFGQVSDTPAGTFSGVAAGGAYSVAIAELDNQPPVITCPGPVVLWSPNHELVDVSSAISVSDPDGDPVTLTFRVFSDETEVPDTGDGTGRHAPDFKNETFAGGRGVLVRSERRAREDGRFYIAVITADDGNGGVTTAVCTLAVVPRDQNEQSLGDVLAQADAAAVVVQAAVDSNTLPPSGVNEHGLSCELGPHQ